MAGPRHASRLVLVGVAVLAVLALVAGGITALRLAGSGGPAPQAEAPTERTFTQSSASAAPAVVPSQQIDGQAPGKSGAPSPSASVAPGTLLAADEFTGAAVDTTKWGIYESTAPNGSSMTANSLKVAADELQVIGAGKVATGKGNTTGGLCWCAGIGNRTYGIWKVRARFDAGLGYAPTIGLWPKSDKGSVDGAMNLARLPEADRKTLYSSVSWNAPGVHAYNRTVKGDFTAWHTYTVEWRATFVKMYLDDQLLFDSAASTTPVVIPKVPMHVYIQLTAGPNGDVAAPGPNTPAQVVTHVDWVRMYA